MTAVAPRETDEQRRQLRPRTPGGWLAAAMAAASFVGWFSAVPDCAARATATLLPAGDALELKTDGLMTTLPVHQAGGVRYFSAGVGLEERQADYPPFPLKLIFIAGSRAYLSKVDVSITNASGMVRLDIPADHVNGPWLFVDLPAGTYDIRASSRGTTLTKEGVHVVPGKVRTIYLRWPEGPEELY